MREVQELLTLRCDMGDVNRALRSAKEFAAVQDFMNRGKPSQAVYALIRALRDAGAKEPATDATPSETDDLGALTEVRMARRCLNALYLEVEPPIARDVALHVENAFNSIKKAATAV